VCTNISCSLLGGDEMLDALIGAAAGDESIHVRSFECLGACDIAPMASVDGVYVGPLDTEDAHRIVEDLDAGRTVLDHKQLRYRRSTDPGVIAEEAGYFAPDPAKTDMADTAGLGPEGDNVDRPGPTAAIETPTEQDENNG